MTEPLWIPSDERIASANLTRFVHEHASTVATYHELHLWSTERPWQFWPAVWNFCGVIGDPGNRVVDHLDRLPGAVFFPEGSLNFTENLLRRRDTQPALVFRDEEGSRRVVSCAELDERVRRFAAALLAAGTRPGDRVAGYLPNIPETIVAALGAAAIGAVWSSCSPDFGVQGVLDRFGQIAPRVLVAADGYRYAGRQHDCRPRITQIASALPSVDHVVIVPHAGQPGPAMGDREIGWEDFLETAAAPLATFERFPFNHPLYIMYSSGTTGVPKCLVHGAGGTLIQHLKEHQLHCDIRRGDRVFYFTTCGWMMWNWLVSVLASEATLLLFDGSPVHPAPTVLFDIARTEGMTLFGTSAKYIDAIAKAGINPMTTHDLSSVRTMTSTGSPLVPESFDFVYAKVKRDLHLASISGGTDIIGCFVGGVPTLPVWRGEIQAPHLGMRVEVFDDEGRSVKGQKGELVCTLPFPSMPVGFWNDPDGARYRAAYFEKFPGVWHHGDYVEITSHGGLIIYGRSDAVLNPGGVRIGTAEIYRQVEQLDEVVESLVIGQSWDNDERVVLFVRLREGLHLTPEMEERIRRRIRENATPRHVPARIVQVTDIPRTKSGKIVELAVREVVHDRPVKNREALANPDALEQFKNRVELKR